MRSDIRTIADDLPVMKIYDDDPKRAMSVKELAAAAGISESHMGKLAREKFLNGKWERAFRHVKGGSPLLVYRLTGQKINSSL